MGNKQSVPHLFKVSSSVVSIGLWLILAFLFYMTPLIPVFGLKANQIAPVVLYGASALILLHATSLAVRKKTRLYPLLSKLATVWGYGQILWLIAATGVGESPFIVLLFVIALHAVIYWGIRIATFITGVLVGSYGLRLVIGDFDSYEVWLYVIHSIVLMGITGLAGYWVTREARNARKRQEENFYADQLYNELLEWSPAPIVVHSKGTMLYINKAATELLGASSPSELSGRSIYEFVDSQDHSKISSGLEQAGTSLEPLSSDEVRVVRTDGRAVRLEFVSSYIHHFMGHAVIQSVLRDTSEQRRKEELIRRSEKLSVVGQLAAGVAHEIRNPLTSLMGFTQLLKSRNEDNHKFYDIMLSELHRINSIVNEFMVLSKPQNVNFRYTSLISILKSVISLINTQAIMNNIQIITKLDPDLPRLRCDENQLKQLFINLLKNALEAMPDGGIVKISAQLKAPDKLVVSVMDQGIGIPQQFMSRIGEPFFTTKDNGTGLGLMTCWRIVESHRGQLNIKSKETSGTTVEVCLPLHANEHL
ncbi:ATP-binding protein [Paenibacillus sp. J2TS4]|uniref:ATP-binding protein n=1 Tax=Paenibacillus sp. J2TS4 TaxID=2807194 RepID=UPI001B07FFAA|nr:ATP-binding protein [Paenibacillus sp. J2TS4]GIP34429.1 hypothetical protein J2TS4_36390 [Paenibacillus sp. J2TS4]